MATATKPERTQHKFVVEFGRYLFASSHGSMSVPPPPGNTRAHGHLCQPGPLSVWRQPDRAGPASERSDQKTETIASAEKSGTKRVHGLMEDILNSVLPVPLGISSTAADRCGDVTCVLLPSSLVISTGHRKQFGPALSCPVVVAHAELLLPSSSTVGNVGEGEKGWRIAKARDTNTLVFMPMPPVPMLRDDAAIPASPMIDPSSRGVRESGPCVQCSRGVEPVWIIRATGWEWRR